MSLDEPESTDRNTPLGKQPWNNDTGFSTLVPAADLNVIDVVSAIDVVDSVDDDVVEDVISADVHDSLVVAADVDDDLVEAAVAGSVSVTSVVVSAEPVIADVLNSDDVCYPVIDSSVTVKGREAVRSALSTRR